MWKKWNLVIIALISLGVIYFGNVKNIFAANFPEKPIKIIVPFSPGSGIDAEARGIAPYLQKNLGVTVTIENIPGADGRIGLTRAWKANPDGYTYVMHTTTMSLIGEALFNPEYRVLDFSRIFSWTSFNQVLVVNNDSWKNLDEFTKAARTSTLSVGMPGRGSASHLMGLILVDGLGIKVNWVPFDGGAGAITALAGKHIDFASVATTTALPLVKANKLRPLLVLADQKDPVFPEIPISKDLGYQFPSIPTLRGIDGPPKMEMSKIKVIEAAFAKSIKEPDYVAFAKRRMTDLIPLYHEAYQKAIERQHKEVEKYKGYFKEEK